MSIPKVGVASLLGGTGCVWGTDYGEGERECVMSSASTKYLPAYQPTNLPARLTPSAQCAQSEQSSKESLAHVHFAPARRELIWGSRFHAIIIILFYPKPSSSRQCPSLLMGEPGFQLSVPVSLTNGPLLTALALALALAIHRPHPTRPCLAVVFPALAVAISPHPLAHLTDCHRR